LEKRLSAINNQRNTGDVEDLALIIGMNFGLHDIAISSLFV